MKTKRCSFDTAKFTDPGGRFPNEDSLGVVDDDFVSGWAVADGLGGHVHGEDASKKAVSIFEKCLSVCEKVNSDFLKQTFDEINDQVKILDGPLTTLVTAFFDGDGVSFANVGDSRGIFFHHGKISFHTKDHSVAYLFYLQNEITYDEIQTHPAQNRLIRAIGSEEKSHVEIYDSIAVVPGDALLLCSDGFWELVYTKEMESDLEASKTAEDWMEKMLSRLRGRLKDNSDNYTAVAVRFS